MKLLLLAALATFVLAGLTPGQTAKRNDVLEQEIRRLDLGEAEAVLHSDFATSDRLWAADYRVNARHNKIERASTGPIRTGNLKYSSFVREIESVFIHGETVIVMGRETVTPRGNSHDRGKVLYRRYTNIWMKIKGRWRLIACHANVICQS